MCNWCKPDGWKRRTCSYCGWNGPSAYVSISIAIYDDSPQPYSTLDYCRECWEVCGVDDAMASNREEEVAT